jgi:hypothetical protein
MHSSISTHAPLGPSVMLAHHLRGTAMLAHRLGKRRCGVSGVWGLWYADRGHMDRWKEDMRETVDTVDVEDGGEESVASSPVEESVEELERARPEHKTVARLKEEVGYEGLFSSSPDATLAMISVAAGLLGLGTLLVEVLTGGRLARAMGLDYLSVPLGVAAGLVGLLVARRNGWYAIPGLLLCVLYWVFWGMTR